MKTHKSFIYEPRALDIFRGLLHLPITARQFGKPVSDVLRSKIMAWFKALSVLSDDRLSTEIAAPVLAILDQIENASWSFQKLVDQDKFEDPAEKETYKTTLKQLDLALAMIFREVTSLAFRRAMDTNCSDLLMEVLVDQTNSRDLLPLIRRWQKEFAKDSREPDGSLSIQSMPDCFAGDTAQRVETLDRLADEYPEHVGVAARYMNVWPMLVHPHASDKKRLYELIKSLHLGANYPLAVGPQARFRTDTPMVRYLDPLVFKLADIRDIIRSHKHNSPEHEKADLKDRWRWIQSEKPAGDSEINLLRTLRALPVLTKSTAIEWSEKIVVPVIMVTDAADWQNSPELALKSIARQRGVKSRATFKSRLLAAVTSTLRRLVRPL